MSPNPDILSQTRENMLWKFMKFGFRGSSVHGFAHMVERKAHPMERLMWCGLIAGAIYGAVILSSMTLTRYRDNPTVISMERDRFSWNTSFPAATICPTKKVDLDAVDKFILESKFIRNKTCFREFVISLSEATYTNFDKVVNCEGIPSSDNFMNIVRQFTFKFRPSVSNSGRIMENNDGESLTLHETVTEMGICYSLNSHLAIYNSFSYWNKGHWKLLPENKTFSVNPLDGEVFANVVNMSSGFQLTIRSQGACYTGTETIMVIPVRPFLMSNNLSIVQRKNNLNVLIKKLKRSSWIHEYMMSFLTSSSLHCLRHLVERRRHHLEKIMWFCFIVGAICGVTKIIIGTMHRYLENPVVISVEKDHFVWNTSFPSITVCPSSKLNTDLLEEYIEYSVVDNKTLLRTFLEKLAYADYNNLDTIPYYDEIPGQEFLPLLLDLQSEFTPSVSNSGIKDISFTMIKVISEMGICYSFNSYLAIYNSPQYWDEGSWELIDDDANEIFNVNVFDGDNFANMFNISSGYNVYIHGPYEVVDIASKYISSPNGYFLQLYLSGLTLFSSESTKSLGIDQRKCRFYYESDLRHSPVYSYVLCRMECRASLANRLCGCTPHFYRKLDGERVCNVTGLHCLAKYKDRLTLLKNECSCLANCDEVNYVIEDVDTREWFLGSNLQWGFKDYPKMRLRRDVIFGFADLLVYIGGMAGLFLGCSVLSFIEIVYFFTLRLYWFVTKYEKVSRPKF